MTPSCIVHVFCLIKKVSYSCKHSTIIPVPKKAPIPGLNTYRPVTLTSVVMTTFERLLLSHIKGIKPTGLSPAPGLVQGSCLWIFPQHSVPSSQRFLTSDWFSLQSQPPPANSSVREPLPPNDISQHSPERWNDFLYEIDRFTTCVHGTSILFLTEQLSKLASASESIFYTLPWNF